jgi:hypothetical protein
MLTALDLAAVFGPKATAARKHKPQALIQPISQDQTLPM